MSPRCSGRSGNSESACESAINSSDISRLWSILSEKKYSPLKYRPKNTSTIEIASEVSRFDVGNSPMVTKVKNPSLEYKLEPKLDGNEIGLSGSLQLSRTDSILASNEKPNRCFSHITNSDLNGVHWASSIHGANLKVAS